MKVLILGGTQFIGRNLVERLIELKECDITLFNRGKSGPDLFPAIGKITGDRKTSDIKKIKGDWDVVIDLSCYFPADLESALAQLNPTKTKYIFISTCSVYEPEFDARLRTEDSLLRTCSKEEALQDSPETYGRRKAACERTLGKSKFNHAILRPSLVYGKYDPTDRLYYWLHQVKNHPQLLLPDNGDRVFSITYVDDLITAIIKLINSNISGIFTAVSETQTSIGEIVKLAADQLNTSPLHINAPVEFLNSEAIGQWIDMPLWINGDHFTYSNSKLRSELGIETTSMEAGIYRTIEYFSSLGWPTPTYGISEEKRQALLSDLT